ncbi:hypothetical protein Tco_0723424 [Tanacetum coccineum]
MQNNRSWSLLLLLQFVVVISKVVLEHLEDEKLVVYICFGCALYKYDKILVKLVARAFYDDFTANEDKQVKPGWNDKGIAVVVLDALTRYGNVILRFSLLKRNGKCTTADEN